MNVVRQHNGNQASLSNLQRRKTPTNDELDRYLPDVNSC